MIYKNQKQLNKALKKWKKILRLQEWDITAQISRAMHFNLEGVQGENRITLVSKQAFSNPRINSWDCSSNIAIPKVRRNNRQIHKAKILKGGKRKNNQAPFVVKGFRLFDKVKYQRRLYYIFGRRSSGAFDIRTLNGEKVNKGSINCKYLQLINFRKTWLIERRSVVSSHG